MLSEVRQIFHLRPLCSHSAPTLFHAKCPISQLMCVMERTVKNPLAATLFNWNFHPLEFSSEGKLFRFYKKEVNYFQILLIDLIFIELFFNMFKRWYVM